MRVLGLDVSTSCVGIAIVEDVESAIKIVELDHLDFKGCKTLFDKADNVSERLFRMRDDRIDVVFIEDAMMKFTPGMSSAQTIATLLRFNGIVSYAVWQKLHQEPRYVAPNAARKLCGIKTEQVKKCGKSHKIQTAEYLLVRELKTWPWPLNRNGKMCSWCYDVIDAYVIAKAAHSLCTLTTPQK